MKIQVCDVSTSSFNIKQSISSSLNTSTETQLIISLYTVQLLDEISNLSPAGLVRRPSPPTARDIAETYRPKIHDAIPGLKNLSDDTLEKLIGERNNEDIEYE